MAVPLFDTSAALGCDDVPTASCFITTDLAGLAVGASKFVEMGLAKLLLVGEDSFWGGGDAPAPAYGDKIRHLESILSDELPAAWPDIDPEQIALLQYTGGTEPPQSHRRHQHLSVLARRN